jgi:hypothetical protein
MVVPLEEENRVALKKSALLQGRLRYLSSQKQPANARAM